MLPCDNISTDKLVRLCYKLLLLYAYFFSLGEILNDVLSFIIFHYNIKSVRLIILHGG